MDNDRKDTDTSLSDDTQPKERTNIPVTLETDPPTNIDSLEGMTHGKTEISTPSTDVEVEPVPISLMETATVAPEVEPTTVAFTPGSPSPQEQTRTLTDESEAPAGVTAPAIAAAETTASITTSPANKKRIILLVAAIIGVFVVVGLIAWWMLMGNNDESVRNAESTLSSSTEQAKLGVALTVIDGSVEASIDGEEWSMATAETRLEEGYSIRTDAVSRAVLTLDDGSAVRLDANTRIKLTSLSSDDIRIEQAVGSVYSRVVPSERGYTILVDDTSYEALGTAFVTVKNETESGVQVYESSVKTNESDEAVTEGKQFYKVSSDAALQGNLTDINLDTLIDNTFVNWNLTQDESDANFKERMGVLLQIKEKAAARAAERQATIEQAAKDEAARVLKEKQEAERKEKEAREQANSGKVTRGTMTLSLIDKTFTWNYTGKAVHGYKLVYTKKSSTPTFGIHDARYYGNIAETKGELPMKSEIGSGKYYVRVCAYTADTEDEKCVDYSNMVVINI